MVLVVGQDGTVRCLYGEEIDLASLGRIRIRRASNVNPDDSGSWWADLSPIDGPRLGPFPCRSASLRAEEEWLTRTLAWQLTPAATAGCNVPQLRQLR